MFNVTMLRTDLTLEILRSMQADISCEKLLEDFPQDHKLLCFNQQVVINDGDNRRVSWGSSPEMALRLLRLLWVADGAIEVDVKHLPVTLALIDQFREQLAGDLSPVDVFISLDGEILLLGGHDREFGSRLKRAFPQVKLRSSGYYDTDVNLWASQFDSSDSEVSSDSEDYELDSAEVLNALCRDDSNVYELDSAEDLS